MGRNPKACGVLDPDGPDLLVNGRIGGAAHRRQR